MLHLVDFIKDNQLDWEERLQEEPYSLNIKRKDNVILFCYNQIRSDFREKIVKESKGIILEDKTFRVLAYPFDKFFNSLSDVVRMAQELPFNEEGYIVIDSNWRRVKVKSPAYVAVHHLKGNCRYFY